MKPTKALWNHPGSAEPEKINRCEASSSYLAKDSAWFWFDLRGVGAIFVAILDSSKGPFLDSHFVEHSWLSISLVVSGDVI